MKRYIVIAVSAALLFAVATQATAQTADTNIFGIELGQVIGYNFDNEDVGVGQLMAIQFGLAESMEVGFAFISGEPGANPDMPDFALVRLSYFMQDMLAFRLSTGSSTAGTTDGVAAGAGIVTSPFRRTINDSFTTALNLSLDYLIPDVTADFDEGIFAVSITGKVAF